MSGAYCTAGWSGTIGRQCNYDGTWSSTAVGGCSRTFKHSERGREGARAGGREGARAGGREGGKAGRRAGGRAIARVRRHQRDESP